MRPGLNRRQLGCRQRRRTIEERTLVNGLAPTTLSGLEPVAHRLGARDQCFDLRELLRSDRLEAIGCRLRSSLDELADLIEGESGALGDVDDGEPAQHARVVNTLAGDAIGLLEQPDLLVVANRALAEPGQLGDLADAQLFSSFRNALDLKSA